MSATAAMIARLRLMVNEPDDSNGYDDDALTALIESYPLLDERGEPPYTWDTATEPPTQDSNDDWIATYDLHRAAADIWEEKAATKAHLYMFSADGGQYSRHQVYSMFMQQARHHLARRTPGSHMLTKWPPETGTTWEINTVELD